MMGALFYLIPLELIKSVVILFFACFLCYLPFSRQPDFFDSETTPALIIQDGNNVFAIFKESGKSYKIQLDKEKFRDNIGERIVLRYELSNPALAKINQIMQYWVDPKEIGWAFGILLLLLAAAYATTNRPDPASLAAQLNIKKENKTKYE